MKKNDLYPKDNTLVKFIIDKVNRRYFNLDMYFIHASITTDGDNKSCDVIMDDDHYRRLKNKHGKIEAYVVPNVSVYAQLLSINPEYMEPSTRYYTELETWNWHISHIEKKADTAQPKIDMDTSKKRPNLLAKAIDVLEAVLKKAFAVYLNK